MPRDFNVNAAQTLAASVHGGNETQHPEIEIDRRNAGRITHWSTQDLRPTRGEMRRISGLQFSADPLGGKDRPTRRRASG